MHGIIFIGDERMDERFVSIGKAAKMIGMSIEGLRHWESAGVLMPMRTLTNPRTAPRTFSGVIGWRICRLCSLRCPQSVKLRAVSCMRVSPRRNNKQPGILIANSGV